MHQVNKRFSIRLEERVEERTRIARELHDTLLQSFQGLMLRFQAVHELMPDGTAKKQLQQTLKRADHAIAEGRSAVYDLRSSTTLTNDLAQAVRALGSELGTEEITYAERLFRLRIRDDGGGIPSEVLNQGRPGHYGLNGMRERAEQIGANFGIWSGAAGAGTEIELTLSGSIAYGKSENRFRLWPFREKVGSM
jgi:signal transduction histidine kinase